MPYARIRPHHRRWLRGAPRIALHLTGEAYIIAASLPTHRRPQDARCPRPEPRQ